LPASKYPNNREGWSLWYLDLSEAQQRIAKTERDHADAMDLMADSSREMGVAIAACDDADIDAVLDKARELAGRLSGDRGWRPTAGPGGGEPPKEA
jgi:alpha-D-ribose 1-methylphosphonate 5-triphosphate diphosphatase PhnM